VGHWTKILADETVIKRTVLFNGRVAGNVVRSARRKVSTSFG
jgi:hypothetical protein